MQVLAVFGRLWCPVSADIAFDTELEFDFEVRALPSPGQGLNLIYRGEAFAEAFSIDIVDAFREVKVGGTQPLDNASGGFVGIDPGLVPCSIVQVDQPRFCFIPSVSAIEVGPFVGTGVPLADVNADISDNATILASGLTTVDRYMAWDNALPSGANPSTFNQFHTSFSTDNTGTLLYELRAEGAATGLLNDRTFNYGASEIAAYNYQNPPAVFPVKQTTNYIDGNLTVESSGKLWINRSGRIAYTDVAGNPNALHPSSFDVYLDTRILCSASSTSIVTIRNSGMLEIGEWDGSIQNKGNLFVGGIGQLIVDNGGTMKINKNSKGVLLDGGYGVVKSWRPSFR